MRNSEAGTAAPRGIPLRVDLAAALQDSLLPAVSNHAQLLVADDPWAIPALTHPDKVEELDGAATEVARVFSFRKVERNPDGTSVGKREPLTREVLVELRESANPSEWIASARPDPVLRPDPTMRREGSWPEARYHSRSAEKVRSVAPTLADTELITEIRVVEDESLDDGNSTKLTVTMWDTSSFDVVASVDPMSGRLTVTADDGTSYSEQLRIDGRTSVMPGLAANRAVQLALDSLLKPIVGKHLGYVEVPRNGPSYQPNESGVLLPTTAGYGRYHTGIQALRLHQMAFVPHPYLRDTIHKTIEELGLRKGQPNFEAHRTLASAEAPEVKALFVKHGGRWRPHAPAWTDSYTRSLSKTTGRVILRQVDNLVAGRLSPNPDQQARYTAAVLSGILRPTLRSHFRMRQRAREGSETVPIHYLEYERLWPHVAIDLSSGVLDVGGRLGVDELTGGSTNRILQFEIGARRMAQTPMTAVRDWRVDPSWLPVGTFERQAVNVAGRTEAVGEFSKIREKYQLIREAMTVLLADPSVDGKARQELLATVSTFHEKFEKTWKLIREHDLKPGAFQTKEGPVRIAPLGQRVKSEGLPASGGLAAGIAIGGWQFGYLGVPAFAQVAAGLMMDNHFERLKATERAKLRKLDAEALFQAEREQQREFARKLAEGDKFADGYTPLSAKSHASSIVPNLPGAAVGMAVGAPVAAGAFLVPELRELAEGLIYYYLLTPAGSAVDSFLHRYIDHRMSAKEQRLWHEIAVANKAPAQLLRSPTGVAHVFKGLTTELAELVDELTTLHDRVDDNFTREKLPPLPEALAAVREGVLAHGSLVEAEYFRKVAMRIGQTPAATESYLKELVPGYNDLSEQERGTAAAAEFRAEIERRFKGIAVAELAGKFMSEHLPANATLEALAPESESRTILNDEYLRLSRLITSQRWSQDRTGRIFSIAWQAAINNGGGVRSVDDPEKLTLSRAMMDDLLPHACKLIHADIACVASGWNLEDVLTGIPPAPGTEHAGMSLAKAEGWLSNQITTSFVRERYVERVTDWLNERRARVTEIRQQRTEIRRHSHKSGQRLGLRRPSGGGVELPEPGPAPPRRYLVDIPADVVAAVTTTDKTNPHSRPWPKTYVGLSPMTPADPELAERIEQVRGEDYRRGLQCVTDTRNYQTNDDQDIFSQRLATRLMAAAPGIVAGAFAVVSPTLRLAIMKHLDTLPAGIPGQLAGPRHQEEIELAEFTALKTIEVNGGRLAPGQLQRMLDLSGRHAARLPFVHSSVRPDEAMQQAEADLRLVEHLAAPTVDAYGNRVPTSNSQLLAWSKDGTYTREWVKSRSDYPSIIAVRLGKRENSVGKLTLGEFNFVNAPRGMILECGIPNPDPPNIDLEDQLNHGGRQVVEAIQYAQMYGTDEIILVSDDEPGCKDVADFAVDCLAKDLGIDVSQIERGAGLPRPKNEQAPPKTWHDHAFVLLPVVGAIRHYARTGTLNLFQRNMLDTHGGRRRTTTRR